MARLLKRFSFLKDSCTRKIDSKKFAHVLLLSHI